VDSAMRIKVVVVVLELSDTPACGTTQGSDLEGHAPPEYLMVINPDTYIRDVAPSTLLRFMETHPEDWLAGAKVQDPQGGHQNGANTPLSPGRTRAWRCSASALSVRIMANGPGRAFPSGVDARGRDLRLPHTLLLCDRSTRAHQDCGEPVAKISGKQTEQPVLPSHVKTKPRLRIAAQA